MNIPKMKEWCRIFGLLLYKNFIVRLRHWKVTLFFQVLMPIALFALIQAVRDFNSQPPTVIETDTYYPPISREILLNNIDLSLVNIYYVPNNPRTYKIMESAMECMGIKNFTGFATEKEMIDTYLVNRIKDTMNEFLAVVFDANQEKGYIKYKMRHSSRIPKILFYDTDYISQVEYKYLKIVPFVQLQMCIDNFFITEQSPFESMPDIFIQKMPYPPHVKANTADTILRQLISVFAVVIFLIPLCIETNYIAKEKFIGVNTLMAMNGVKLYQNLLSWLFTGCIFSIFYVIPIIVLFKNTFSSNVDPYLYNSNVFIFWLLMTVHVIHLISFGMHVAAYFSKPVFVNIILSVVYTASSSLHGSLVQENFFSTIPYVGIIFPNFLLSRLFEEVNTYEDQLTGIRWSNFFTPGVAEYNITGSIGFILLFSLLGITIHFTLAVYINTIRPGKYGVRKHPLYFLQCMKKNKVCLDEEAEDYDYNELQGVDFEVVNKGALIPGIQIRGLTKCYHTGFLKRSMVHALKGVSVDFYKGQITALLGHNGAGKTTLMSIITGVRNETDGKIFINGKNLKHNLDTIRNDLGLCPQENMVFPDLNVFEQIEFFGLLKNKNKTKQQIKRDVNNLLSKLKLTEKRNCLPDKLSGGQKRRVCLGMALIGDASIFILDEPTSGMDPETRRDTWDIILKMRGEKTIIISTHNMEEADILGDRIAIVHGGLLRSYGSPMFLKKQYGHGHIEVTLSTKSWCDPEKVVNKFDSRSQVTIDNDKIVLNVPFTEALPNSLDLIESQKKTLGVTGINVSLITLEQVFLKIINKEDNGKHLTEHFTTPIPKLQGCQLQMQVVLALLAKKMVYARKNPGILIMILFLPLISILFMALSYSNPAESLDVVPIRLDMYNYPVAFYSENSKYGPIYKELIEHFNGVANNVVNTSVTNELLKFGRKDLAEYHNHAIVSAEFNATSNGTRVVGFYSRSALHSLPITMNLLSNTILRALSDSKNLIEVSRQKLPDAYGYSSNNDVEMDALSRLMILCSFLFPTLALFVIHPLQEMSTKVKQLQRMTGVTSVSYWITMFSFDLVLCISSVIIITLGFYIMDIILDIRLYHITEIFITILLLLLLGINSLMFAYIFSFIKKSRSTVITILSLSPIGIVILQYLLHIALSGFKHLETLHSFQMKLFRFVPYVSFFHAKFAFFSAAIINAKCRRFPSQLLDRLCSEQRTETCCEMDCTNGICKNTIPYFKDFETDINLAENVVYLALTPLLYFAILIMLEEKLFGTLLSKLINKIRHSAQKRENDKMDEEVKKEKHAVALEISKIESQRNILSDANDIARHKNVNDNSDDDVQTSKAENRSLFLVYELSKSFGKLMAVKEVNFRVKQHECFGLLGVNGAGKSTTFRILTGEETPNSGIMYLKQAEIHTDRKNYLAEMGYCPQTDAMINSLNAFDHLRLFANLRGIPKDRIELEVNKWINRLNLKACMSQPSGTYSGGNKRRLNIAMALIGNPTLVLLDEPTTGVDPAARRSLWTVLQSCQASGQAIILTSHSMEECEALCNRLVIMVKGELVCIGASQELKQRFGAGFDIHIKLNPVRSETDVTNIKNTIESSLTCEIRDENLGFISYHVTDPTTSWTTMYNTVYDLKRRYACIQDYSVLSATLEHLFIQFARGMTMPDQEKSPKHSTSQPINE